MNNNLKEELINQFARSVENAAATVEKVSKDAVSLNNALLAVCSDDDFVLLGGPDDLDEELFHLFKSNSKVITEPTREQLRTIKTGVTDAFCAIASTGSVCVSITNKLTSPASMLTRRHIAVVDADTIVPLPRNVFSEDFLNGKGLRRSFSFITGPSATADMGPLVRGVHGPGKLHIIILE